MFDETMRIGGKHVKVIKPHENLSYAIIECPNCGQPTWYGETRMISGYVGCDNRLPNGRKCYFGDLQPRVLFVRESDYERYRQGINMYHIDIEKEKQNA